MRVIKSYPGSLMIVTRETTTRPSCWTLRARRGFRVPAIFKALRQQTISPFQVAIGQDELTPLYSLILIFSVTHYSGQLILRHKPLNLRSQNGYSATSITRWSMIWYRGSYYQGGVERNWSQGINLVLFAVSTQRPQQRETSIAGPWANIYSSLSTTLASGHLLMLVRAIQEILHTIYMRGGKSLDGISPTK